MVEIESITDVEDNWESCKEEGYNAECKEGGSVVVIDTRKEVPKTATWTDTADKTSESGISEIFPTTKTRWRRMKVH